MGMADTYRVLGWAKGKSAIFPIKIEDAVDKAL